MLANLFLEGGGAMGDLGGGDGYLRSCDFRVDCFGGFSGEGGESASIDCLVVVATHVLECGVALDRWTFLVAGSGYTLFGAITPPTSR